MIETKYLKAVALAMLIVHPLFGCALERGSGSGTEQEDSKIAADVQASLSQHPDLGPPNLIYVDVRDHVVYLSGLVNTELTIANAEALARQAPEVTRVVSLIGVEN